MNTKRSSQSDNYVYTSKGYAVDTNEAASDELNMNQQGPLLLTWFNFNLIMDKLLHPL